MITYEDVGIEIPYGRHGDVRARCPKCSPTRNPAHQREKDLVVNVDEGVWFCHHCGWSGTLKTGADGYGTSPKYEKPKPISAAPLPAHTVAYFAEQRGLPESVLTDAGIRYGPVFCPSCGKEVNTLQIPYFRGEEIVHVKYRHTNDLGKKCFFTSAGTERPFYGINDLLGAERAAIVEGEIDQLTMRYVGGIPTVSVPDGSPDPRAKQYASKFNFLVSAAAEMEPIRQVFIATDSDAPGETMASELARRLGLERCYRVRWPEGCNDANETLVKLGPDAVREAFTRATPYPVSGIFRVDELWHELENLYINGRDRGREVGWTGFDKLARARAGLLCIVTGIQHHGKSEFVDNWVSKLALIHEWPVVICSPENQPLADHLASISQRIIGKPFDDGPTQERMTLSELRWKRQWLEDHFTFVLPEQPTVDEIIRLAKIEVMRRGARVLVIDPWTELEHNRPPHMNESEYVGRVLTRLRDFARQSLVFVILVAHPTKLRRVEDRDTGKLTYPRPTLADISGSMNFGNKADIGISVWRNMETDRWGEPTQVHVQKVRFRSVGVPGQAKFHFDPVTLSFHDVDQAPKPRASDEQDPWF